MFNLNILVKIRRIIELRKKKIILQREIKKQNDKLRIILGSANTMQDGWIATNYPLVDITNKKTFDVFFSKRKVYRFLAEHVWEHLTAKEGETAAKNCYEYLEDNGILRIAVPDAFHNNYEYIEYVKPKGYGVGSDDHKVLYNYKMLESLLLKAGFKTKKLEWFDESGLFRFHEWSVADGFIKRSLRFDNRNYQGTNPVYTSLIIDGIKC